MESRILNDLAVPTGMVICSGRISTLTLLYNLNLRRKTAKTLFASNGMPEQSTSGEHSSGQRGRGFKNMFGGGKTDRAARNEMQLQGITVQREQLSIVDDGRVQMVSFQGSVRMWNLSGDCDADSRRPRFPLTTRLSRTRCTGTMGARAEA